MKNFGETLKHLRNTHSLRQEDLAHQIGVSRSRINNYENGFSEPDLTTLLELSVFFDVSLDVLIGRTEVFEDETLHNTLVGVQRTYAALNEQQRELFCQRLDYFVKFLGDTIDELP
ncbi:XRE family transcriptional regulator [Bacillus manliponensis]|uniref:XRE family transcriptional regulator n=1 Tax=Bacillus manliponensis TaxID=574376 RepID=A0A073JTM9_9BACI|nr:helix-turn-helix transcriptional regulator [Bacillus manliponensis]KEK17536.1 XRE family transcriptional regulator [Bacillus manliponensis]